MTGGRWFGRGVGTGDAPVRLFCFAHAGGGGAAFLPWRRALEPDVEVCPVVLPAREFRMAERPYTSVVPLVEAAAAALLPLLDRPYALFGHSMGSVLAYEVARRLSAAGPAPAVLFVSGRRAPHLPARRPPLHALPEDQFLAAVLALNGTPPEVLAHRDLVTLLEPALRADFRLNELYAPLPGITLVTPVSAFTGDADPEVVPAEMGPWRDVTVGEFGLRVFPGDHFYFKARPKPVLAALREDLARWVPVSRRW